MPETDVNRSLGRLEGKVDSQTESLVGIHAKLDTLQTKKDCEDHRARDDARHSKGSDRLSTLEMAMQAGALQRSGWLGSWRAVVMGAGAVFALLGLLASMGLLKLG